MTETDIILSVQDLDVKFDLRGRTLHAIRGVSLDVYRGESLAIVGESGSGKSVFTKSFMGLLDQNGSVTGGHILYGGQDLAGYASEKQWLTIRGREIAMVLQDPMTSLNPLKTIGRQIEEAVVLHQGLKGDAARRAVLATLSDVGIDDPERRYGQYPHEFSGGMRQRVVIAIAVACRPKILICDEPTTALDVTIQAQILDLMKKLQKEDGSSILLITHDLGVVAEMCTRVIVMYAGKIVEMAPVEKLFATPSHPYTQGLIASVPKLGSGVKVLPSIPGSVPDLASMPTGCRFAPRCKYATDKCREQEPELLDISEDQKCRCWRTQEG